MTSGYHALRESAAWLDLGHRGLFRLTGEDRARFLHAMCTNHIQQMNPGDWCYAFFLNSQGRILADAHILCRRDEFLVDVEPSRREFLYGHLDHYIIADDVTLEDISDQYTVLAVEGPKEIAPAGEGITEAGISFTGQPAVRLYVPSADKARVIGELESKDIHLATEIDAGIVRLENARPRYGDDFDDSRIPNETRLFSAIHFSKGCYLGQEIVERVRSRTQPHRLLAQVLIDGNDAPLKGAVLTAGDEKAAEITSAAYSPALQRVAALAYVRTAHAAPGSQLSLDGRAAAVGDRLPH